MSGGKCFPKAWPSTKASEIARRSDSRGAWEDSLLNANHSITGEGPVAPNSMKRQKPDRSTGKAPTRSGQPEVVAEWGDSNLWDTSFVCKEILRSGPIYNRLYDYVLSVCESGGILFEPSTVEQRDKIVRELELKVGGVFSRVSKSLEGNPTRKIIILVMEACIEDARAGKRVTMKRLSRPIRAEWAPESWRKVQPRCVHGSFVPLGPESNHDWAWRTDRNEQHGIQAASASTPSEAQRPAPAMLDTETMKQSLKACNKKVFKLVSQLLLEDNSPGQEPGYFEAADGTVYKLEDIQLVYRKSDSKTKKLAKIKKAKAKAAVQKGSMKAPYDL